MKEGELIPNLFKTEYRKIISVLCKLFGSTHIGVAEDITNDTFLLAAETWGLKGIPDNPTAWLYTVAKNKTTDYLRRNKLFNDKISVELKLSHPESEEISIDLSERNIKDSQLQMIFAICDPLIPAEAQIGLALRILCGFSIDEIAEAFLSNKAAINKRLFRAKEKLRQENVAIEMPNPMQINVRLETVLTTLYLLFNEGYYSSTQNQKLRKDLCLEAMRLNHILLDNAQTNKPISNALMSLMCFHASRFEARTNDVGELILYEAQDRSLWNDELIAKGNYYLIESAKGQEVSKYHLEASIAYWHCTKNEPEEKWERILQLYNKLLQIEYSPIAALNRTFAVAKTLGKEAAITEALRINLEDNHFYHSLLGNLYTDVNLESARSHYTKALRLVKTHSERIVIQKSLERLGSKAE